MGPLSAATRGVGIRSMTTLRLPNQLVCMVAMGVLVMVRATDFASTTLLITMRASTVTLDERTFTLISVAFANTS